MPLNFWRRPSPRPAESEGSAPGCPPPGRGARPLLALAAVLALAAGSTALAQNGDAYGALPEISANAAPRSFTETLNAFLSIPFREDGAQDSQGNWVTFSRPDIQLDSPGFNCSGFAVAAARALLGRDFSLSEATLDRRGDSGPESEMGQDWDFGLDLILNLAEAFPHRYLPEPNDRAAPPLLPLRPGRALGWGVDIHGPDFEELLGQISPGNFCFFVFSRPNGHFPAGVSYYHVGLIVPEGSSRWLYHTTLGAKTNRIDLGSQEGLARLRRYFKPVPYGERRVFMVEVSPPR